MPITATVDIKYSTGASFHMGLTPEEAQKVIDFLFTLRAPHSTGTADASFGFGEREKSDGFLGC